MGYVQEWDSVISSFDAQPFPEETAKCHPEMVGFVS
jgi:hypothetical protein